MRILSPHLVALVALSTLPLSFASPAGSTNSGSHSNSRSFFKKIFGSNDHASTAESSHARSQNEPDPYHQRLQNLYGGDNVQSPGEEQWFRETLEAWPNNNNDYVENPPPYNQNSPPRQSPSHHSTQSAPNPNYNNQGNVNWFENEVSSHPTYDPYAGLTASPGERDWFNSNLQDMQNIQNVWGYDQGQQYQATQSPEQSTHSVHSNHSKGKGKGKRRSSSPVAPVQNDYHNNSAATSEGVPTYEDNNQQHWNTDHTSGFNSQQYPYNFPLNNIPEWTASVPEEPEHYYPSSEKPGAKDAGWNFFQYKERLKSLGHKEIYKPETTWTDAPYNRHDASLRSQRALSSAAVAADRTTKSARGYAERLELLDRGGKDDSIWSTLSPKDQAAVVHTVIRHSSWDRDDIIARLSEVLTSTMKKRLSNTKKSTQRNAIRDMGIGLEGTGNDNDWKAQIDENDESVVEEKVARATGLPISEASDYLETYKINSSTVRKVLLSTDTKQIQKYLGLHEISGGGRWANNQAEWLVDMPKRLTPFIVRKVVQVMDQKSNDQKAKENAYKLMRKEGITPEMARRILASETDEQVTEIFQEAKQKRKRG